jgi:hypothetical protein
MLLSRMYSDADFAGHHVMRKSTSGALFTLNNFPFSLEVQTAYYRCPIYM